MKHYRQPGDIRVGAVGYGQAFNISRIHLTEMRQAGMTPTAVAEIDPARRKAAEEEFPGIETYASLEDMLKQSAVDLIAVNTPHNTHARLALQCLRAGRHVVTEKPFAITTAECDAMIRAAKKRGLLLSTYHNRHWDGCILQAVRLVRRERVVGEVYRVEAHMGGYGRPGNWWRSSKSISGGILYDWGVHLLEYAMQLMEADICEVTGFARSGFWAPQTNWKSDTNEDEGFVAVRFRNGAWLTLCVSHLDSNPKRGLLEVTGTRGAYIMEHHGYEIIRRRGNRTVVTRGQNLPSQCHKFYKNIADHLVRGSPLVISPEWARRPIHILDLANRSARLGKALRARYG